LAVVRYVLPGAMVLGGVVFLVAGPAVSAAEGCAMAVGGGLSVLLINVLYRIGVSGDAERLREEEARAYFDEHGEWPEEEEHPAGRRWSLAPGVVTPEQEQAAKRERP
jgi:hypothetical protein